MKSSTAGVTVSVFGAGIAGLTVAHELAERGFRVLVVESDWDERRGRLILGGSAASYEATVQGVDSAAAKDRVFRVFAPEQGPLTVEPPQALSIERGTRHFRGFCRHLFDTMRRIPWPNADAAGSVFEALVPSSTGSAAGGVVYPLFERLGTTSLLADVQHRLRALMTGQVSPRDLQFLLLRLLRYMTTCPARRLVDCNGTTLAQFCQGAGGAASLPPYRYGDHLMAHLNGVSMALVGLEADAADARSCLSTLIQALAGDYPGLGDCMLSGPSETHWFAPWRKHIEEHGAAFQRGTLQALRVTQGQLVADVDWHGALPNTAYFPSDYYVVATDVVSAENVSRQLRAETGIAADLMGHTSIVPNAARGGTQRYRPRDPRRLAEVGVRPQDRLKARLGVQLFFDQPLQLGADELWLVDTEWRLSCHRLSVLAGSLGTEESNLPALKVQVHALHVPAANGTSAGKTALECTRDELAYEVWRQLEASLGKGEGSAQRCPPRWFAVDDTVQFEDERPVSCNSVWVVPVGGDADNRLGADAPANPGQPDRLRYAGAYAHTFTRFPGAESANESARRAVNSILDHVRESPDAAALRQRWTTAASGEVSNGVAPRLTEQCRIWDPEDQEPLVLRTWRDLDQKLFGQNLPHLSDLLGLELLPRVLSRASPDGDYLLRLLSLFGGNMAENGAQGGSVLEILRRIRSELELKTREESTQGPSHAGPTHPDER